MKFIKNNNSLFNTVLWLIEGIIVGFGAIMPGLSGGTLCVAFGMYFPLISVISHPKENFRTYAKMLIIFGLGSIIGFVGLSGLASYLMEVNLTFTTCFFIGLILGTFPELWESAGKSKRNISSFVSMFLGFSIMLVILILLKNNGIAAIKTDFFGFLLCGLLWGVSLVVPGLSSSSLLLFFNIYQPMLDEISKFNFKVIVPMLIGIVICVTLLSKSVSFAFEKFYNISSHAIIGVVLATTLMLFTNLSFDISLVFLELLIGILGVAVAYILTVICKKIKK